MDDKRAPFPRLISKRLAALCAALALAWPSAAVGARQEPAPASDVPALLLEVARRERALQSRRLEYTWTAKVTDRDLDKRGALKKESVSVYEVYPVRGEFVRKLVSRDGVRLPPGQAEKEFRRAVEALEKAERERQKREGARLEKPPWVSDNQTTAVIPSFGFSSGFGRRGGFSSSEISLSVWRFFRYAEFHTPRRESFKGRDSIVLDFRPRTDFRPAGDAQKPYARLAGRVWIDAADRLVARLEAWPAAQGETAATREPAVVFEHARVAEGVWLESLFRLKTLGAEDVFNGFNLDHTKEAADFRRFEAQTGDDKLEKP